VLRLYRPNQSETDKPPPSNQSEISGIGEI
jgi:hypothetical protein